jgi:hypothetical protein
MYEPWLAPVVTMNQWLNQKMRPTQFGDYKNAPSLDYVSQINETHQKDYVAPLKIEESDNIPCDNRDLQGFDFGYDKGETQ